MQSETVKLIKILFTKLLEYYFIVHMA